MQRRSGNLKQRFDADVEHDMPMEDDKNSEEPFTSLDLENGTPSQHNAQRDEFRKETILNDIKVFGILFQVLFGVFFIGLIALNVFNINHYCKLMLEENSFRCKCTLEKCHYNLMGISFGIINLMTGILLTYDYNQAKKKGYRLNEYFLYFIGKSFCLILN